MYSSSFGLFGLFSMDHVLAGQVIDSRKSQHSFTRTTSRYADEEPFLTNMHGRMEPRIQHTDVCIGFVSRMLQWSRE
jgi:hypothetical protein